MWVFFSFIIVPILLNLAISKSFRSHFGVSRTPLIHGMICCNSSDCCCDFFCSGTDGGSVAT